MARRRSFGNPRENCLSSLAIDEGWSEKLPPLRGAFDQLGPLRQTLAERMGCSNSPPTVLVGIHDSNANYARYLAAGLKRLP